MHEPGITSEVFMRARLFLVSAFLLLPLATVHASGPKPGAKPATGTMVVWTAKTGAVHRSLVTDMSPGALGLFLQQIRKQGGQFNQMVKGQSAATIMNVEIVEKP